jgi:hypothetical protein
MKTYVASKNKKGKVDYNVKQVMTTPRRRRRRISKRKGKKIKAQSLNQAVRQVIKDDLKKTRRRRR